MFNWIVRGLWFVAGVVTGWFIASDAINFGVVQMVVALLLLTLIVGIFAFWPAHWRLKRNRSKEEM